MAKKKQKGKKFFFRRPLSPEQDSGTAKEFDNETRQRQEAIGTAHGRISTGYIWTSYPRHHSSTAITATAQSHDYWKRAQEKLQLCEPQLCDCDGTSKPLGRQADERIVRGTTRKSFGTAASNRITDTRITSGSSAPSESMGNTRLFVENHTLHESLEEFLVQWGHLFRKRRCAYDTSRHQP